LGELRITVSDKLHRKLKYKALDEEMTLRELVSAILESYFGSEPTTRMVRREGAGKATSSDQAQI
jgi:hypothetical protein